MSFWKETVLPLRDELQRRFPKCFVVRGDMKIKKRALKRGIHLDIIERWPEVDPHLLKLSIGDYIQGKKYLSASFDGAVRIDLDGNPSGAVTRDDRLFLIRKHERRLGLMRKKDAEKVIVENRQATNS